MSKACICNEGRLAAYETLKQTLISSVPAGYAPKDHAKVIGDAFIDLAKILSAKFDIESEAGQQAP